ALEALQALRHPPMRSRQSVRDVRRDPGRRVGIPRTEAEPVPESPREAASGNARGGGTAVGREERDIPPKPTGITRSEWDGAAFRKWQDAVRRAHYRSGDDERDKGNA